MEVFVRRRGETAAIGPLTAAEVASMRIRWEISDADYYREAESDRWRLVGDLDAAPPRRKHNLLSTGLSLAGAVAVVLFAILSFSSNTLDPQTADDPVSLATQDSQDDDKDNPLDPSAPAVPDSAEPAGAPAVEANT